MKTIGLIGGMSWESSAEYYRLINQETKRRLGGHHNARSVMVTVDFAEVERLQHEGDWEELGAMLAEAARQLERGGADCVVLCTNTMHKLADHITAAVQIPLLHIVDATAAAIGEAGLKRVGLLGTKFTMEEPFYVDRMRDRFGIETLVPSPDSRDRIHRIIYDELCHGVIREESREAFRRIIADLAEAGAQGIIFGCTEIGQLISQSDTPLPVFDSTALHASVAVGFAIDRQAATGWPPDVLASRVTLPEDFPESDELRAGLDTDFPREVDELNDFTEVLDRRYDDLEGGRVQPLDGAEAFRILIERTERQRIQRAAVRSFQGS